MRTFLYGPTAMESLDDLDSAWTRPRAFNLSTTYTTINTISFITMVVRESHTVTQTEG